ncbi:MAG: hypothetical protein LBQ31_05900, partial [Bacteroidales bacterium]|nr:hypothetical protein [Bacteroidales bacterium]
ACADYAERERLHCEAIIPNAAPRTAPRTPTATTNHSCRPHSPQPPQQPPIPNPPAPQAPRTPTATTNRLIPNSQLFSRVLRFKISKCYNFFRYFVHL